MVPSWWGPPRIASPAVDIEVSTGARSADPRHRGTPPAPLAPPPAASAPPTTASSPSSWPSTLKRTGHSASIRSSSCPGIESRAQVSTASSTLCRDGQLDRIRTGVYQWSAGQRAAARKIPAPRHPTTPSPSTPSCPRGRPRPQPASPDLSPQPSCSASFPGRRPDDRRAIRRLGTVAAADQQARRRRQRHDTVKDLAKSSCRPRPTPPASRDVGQRTVPGAASWPRRAVLRPW